MEMTKSTSVFTGKVPIYFYFALILPVLISYLEYSMQTQSTLAIILKYTACFLTYCLCIEIINKQKIVINKHEIQFSCHTSFLNISKSIAMSDVKELKDHSFIPCLKVLRHGNKETFIFSFFKNKEELFQKLKGVS